MRDNQSKLDNCVSEMRILPTSGLPSVIVSSNGRMTKLMPPTEAKFGAFTVCKAVKLSNSNVPLILCKPGAAKDVRDEVRLTLTSHIIRCTP